MDVSSSAAPGNTRLRAAIYVRVSSVRQSERGLSLKTQEGACRIAAAADACEVDENDVYRDVSRGTDLWDRPMLTKLRRWSCSS
jgi:DNA invertase Pin-like site-specific DNA recombinase